MLEAHDQISVKHGGPLTYKMLASLWVVSGTAEIPPNGCKAVRDMVKGKQHTVEKLMDMRGLAHMLPRSALERLLR